MKFLKDIFEGNFPITQRFGENPDRYNRFHLAGHNGVDFGLPRGTKLLSGYGDGSGNHIVLDVGYQESGFGWYIKTKAYVEDKIFELTWAHMMIKPVVSTGFKLSVESILGLSGNTGFGFSLIGGQGYHLHFGMREFDNFGQIKNWTQWPQDENGYKGAIDPLPFFDL